MAARTLMELGTVQSPLKVTRHRCIGGPFNGQVMELTEFSTNSGFVDVTVRGARWVGRYLNDDDADGLLWHAADALPVKHAHALIRVRGQYALQLRDEGIAECPGMWGLFGGAIDPGETPEQAIVREIREELELDATGARPVGQYGSSAVFLVSASHQWRRHVLHEGQAAKLFSVADALRAHLAPYVKQTIEDHETFMVNSSKDELP